MAWMAWHGGMVAYLHEGKQTLVFGSFCMGQEVFSPPVKDRSGWGSDHKKVLAKKVAENHPG